MLDNSENIEFVEFVKNDNDWCIENCLFCFKYFRLNCKKDKELPWFESYFPGLSSNYSSFYNATENDSFGLGR